MTLVFTPLTSAVQCHEYDILDPFFINRRNFYFGFKCFKVLNYFIEFRAIFLTFVES